jgi:hypothetical protein
MKTKKIAFPFLFLILLSIFSSILLVTAQAPTLTLTVATNKQTTYDKYDPITISGTLQLGTESPSNALIGVEIDYPNSTGLGQLVLRTVQTGTGTPTGVPEQITSAYPTNGLGGSKTNSFENGTAAYFTVDVTDLDSQAHNNMLLAVTIFDGNGVPLGVGTATMSMSAGGTQSAYVNIPVPVWAHTGTAYGYADLYSGLPSNTDNPGTPMAQEQPFQFTITGTSTPASGPAPTSSSPASGAYSLAFKLPKYCPDGAYKVYASASWGGTTATAETGFNVLLIGDFDFAGSVTGEDLFIFAAAYIDYYNGQSYNTLCDITNQGKVDSTDFFLFVAAYIQWWSP